jgi:methylenetetrahydrofolate dehydrogenase (NADP+)/methenyltetrahydrofolate cyclohydrolase
VTARVLDGKRIAEELRVELSASVSRFRSETGVVPHLAAILVGSDPASQVYVRSKRKACQEVGMTSSLHELSATTTDAELLSLLDRLNRDDAVHGILLQLPLPEGLDESRMLDAIDPMKDVDGFHPQNVGLLSQGRPRFLPCTPAGVQEILLRSAIPVAGADVVIIGRSNLVGRPLALMMSQRGKGGDATVTLCHSRTRDLAAHVRRADIVVAAIGQPRFVQGSWIKPGATVIDVGINRTADGKLVGDVDYEAAMEAAGAITPVPGGVGRMTVALLLSNTLHAAKLATTNHS